MSIAKAPLAVTTCTGRIAASNRTMQRSTKLTLESIEAHSSATASLLELRKKSSSITMLENPVDTLPRSATKALEELMSSSRKRARQSIEDAPTPMPSMFSCSRDLTLKQPQKFDMTELFLATESSSSDTANLFDFPSLQWPGLGGHDEGEQGRDSHHGPYDAISALSKESNHSRRSLSASSLQGKRKLSGGLLRSKSLRTEVDRLVNSFAKDACQSGLLFSLGSTKA